MPWALVQGRMVGFGRALRDHSILHPNVKFLLFKLKEIMIISNRKRFLLILLVLAGSMEFLLGVLQYQYSEKPIIEAQRVFSARAQRVSVFKKDLNPIFAIPTRLYVKSVKIDIPLLHVSVESDGALQTPKEWSKGGWYIKSSKPGEEGNIIVNAHYDDNYGRPAAFYKLKSVKIDDKVYLVDDYGRHYAYEITDLFYVDIHDPNRLKIFDEVTDMSELTLITCGGVWLQGEGYSKRLVVKASLVS